MNSTTPDVLRHTFGNKVTLKPRRMARFSLRSNSARTLSNDLGSEQDHYMRAKRFGTVERSVETKNLLVVLNA